MRRWDFYDAKQKEREGEGEKTKGEKRFRKSSQRKKVVDVQRSKKVSTGHNPIPLKVFL